MFSKKTFLIIILSLMLNLFILSGMSIASIANPQTVDLVSLVGQVTVNSGNCSFNAVPNILTEAQMPEQDRAFDYPFDLVEFNIFGCPATNDVTLTFTVGTPPGTPANLSGLVYRKYGPTPGNASPHWYNFMYNGQTGAEISGNVVTLHFIDGQRGDDDLTANGTIVDQGGGGRGTPAPAMTEWGMIIFLVLAGIGSIYYIRRKKMES